jgi:hypothetical protein
MIAGSLFMSPPLSMVPSIEHPSASLRSEKPGSGDTLPGFEVSAS